MSNKVRVLEAREVAEDLVEGIVRKQHVILPGEARMLWRLSRYHPGLLRLLSDRQYRQARTQLGLTGKK